MKEGTSSTAAEGKKHSETKEMDVKYKMMTLVLLILYINQVSGDEVPKPVRVEVNIFDGEAMVLWERPEGAPLDSLFNVQIAKYVSQDWTNVSSCMRITTTNCHLDGYIENYRSSYKVRVQLVKGDDKSDWALSKKFLPNESKLLPPSFSLSATSSTLMVSIHDKSILKKLFPFGVTYTIYMEEIGQENKTTEVYVKDDAKEDQRTYIFTGLHWGVQYCVSIKVDGEGALSSSRVSNQQCLLLPEQEFFIIAVSSLSFLGVLAVVVIILSTVLCYLKRPAKIPTALKSPVSGWRPLSVSEGDMEAVTDKGWFLSSYRTEEKPVKLPTSHITVIEDLEEESRRTSMDSGVSTEADSTMERRVNPPARQDDSGCGSMGGPESSAQTDYPLQGERIDTDQVRKREDSAVDMTSCPFDSSSLNLEGHDSELLMKTLIVGNYRSQSPSAATIQSNDSEDVLKQIPADSILAEVVTGYRAGPQSCICSGVGQCSWCHKYGHFGPEVIKPHRPVTDSYREKGTFTPYANKTHMDTVTLSDLDAIFLQISETFPLLTSLPSAMDTNSLSLRDVELTTD